MLCGVTSCTITGGNGKSALTNISGYVCPAVVDLIQTHGDRCRQPLFHDAESTGRIRMSISDLWLTRIGPVRMDTQLSKPAPQKKMIKYLWFRIVKNSLCWKIYCQVVHMDFSAGVYSFWITNRKTGKKP